MSRPNTANDYKALASNLRAYADQIEANAGAETTLQCSILVGAIANARIACARVEMRNETQEDSDDVSIHG